MSTEREADLLAALEVLASVASPRGSERALAEAAASWAAGRWPTPTWQVVPVGDPSGPCAQVVATAGEHAGHDDLLLYSHLDTSLSGDPRRDVAVTGRSDAAAPLVVDLGARTVQGFGLAVAKAPAAAALVGFARAAEHLTGTGEPFGLRLLLAARGTHGAPDWSLRDGPVEPVPVGVETLLAAGRPRAAVVAKAGPAGVLYDEPGACYLRVQARTGWGAVMARDRLVPEGGVLAHLGVLADAVETAGRQLVQAAPAGAQSGAQFGIGAVRSGLPGKPDLAPGVVEVFCYFVAPGPLPAGATASAMAALLAALLAGSPLESAMVTVVDHVVHAGAATDPDAAVVRAARRAWASRFGPEVPITGWTGSTDGIVLRSAGVDTARLGPCRVRPVGDGSDVLDLDELLGCAAMYEQLAVEFGARRTEPR